MTNRTGPKSSSADIMSANADIGWVFITLFLCAFWNIASEKGYGNAKIQNNNNNDNNIIPKRVYTLVLFIYLNKFWHSVPTWWLFTFLSLSPDRITLTRQPPAELKRQLQLARLNIISADLTSCSTLASVTTCFPFRFGTSFFYILLQLKSDLHFFFFLANFPKIHFTLRSKPGYTRIILYICCRNIYMHFFSP